jgi:hypothetical protein
MTVRAKENEAMATWRVGRKLGRTLYKDDQCVGMVDTPELAAEIVRAMNLIETHRVGYTVDDSHEAAARIRERFGMAGPIAHAHVVVGSSKDTGCYSRSGQACEGYMGQGCRHCGRIIGSTFPAARVRHVSPVTPKTDPR